MVHVLPTGGPDVVAVERGSRYGLIVSKSVGDAVTRHAVARRLRVAAAGAEVSASDDPDRSELVVIRALPGAADRSSTELTDELTSALRKAHRRLADDAVGAR
ncbi:ribonuclease P protein component [Williamsia deligens]|nr:ribonuclease P protein component [Williamsia deligens]